MISKETFSFRNCALLITYSLIYFGYQSPFILFRFGDLKSVENGKMLHFLTHRVTLISDIIIAFRPVLYWVYCLRYMKK